MSGTPATPIRSGRYADGAGCAAIYAPFVERTEASFETEPPTAAQMGERIETTLRGFPWLVAEAADGSVAGYAYGGAHRSRAAYRWGAEVSVYVAESARGRGVGGQLYRTLFDVLARQGYRTLLAGVTLPNPASAALHESLGFEPVGVYRRIGYKFGRWHDVGWWQLLLPIDEPGGGELAPPVPYAQLRE